MKTQVYSKQGKTMVMFLDPIKPEISATLVELYFKGKKIGEIFEGNLEVDKVVKGKDAIELHI